MFEIRKSKERGYEDKGWLKTSHTFSFDTYHDQKFAGFKTLRVLNEEILQPGKGFGAHFHKDVEILTYVLEGILETLDSRGTRYSLGKGEILYLSAGSGVNHSEYNLSQVEPVHFLQIWIQPNHVGLEPTYEKRIYSSASKWGRWCLIASSNGREGSIRLHQDADIYLSQLDEKDELSFDAFSDRFYWIQVISGAFLIQNNLMEEGDGASLSNQTSIIAKCLSPGEILLFELGLDYQ